MKIIFILLLLIIFPLFLSQEQDEQHIEKVALEPREEILLGDPTNDVLEGIADFKDEGKGAGKEKELGGRWKEKI